MAYKWKPSASQKRAFAEKMNDPEQRNEYLENKRQREEKRRQSSKYNYSTAGGYYTPTKEQVNFALANHHLAKTPEETIAFDIVMLGEQCHHDHIHIINEYRRKQTT